MRSIGVHGLGKRYTISSSRPGERARPTLLRDALAGAARNVWRGQAGSLLQEKQAFWALRGVDFAVGQGEAVGIVGRNGAGKSTLLKLFSRITEPTEGRIELRGRTASLLEVGTGFHPELTGRENVFLNGVILGMSRAEVRRKFDEIVAFAGVEDFLETPVKRYSSGMSVRLAFAVAAHLEPEILIVDEVLAVGDAEFQKKCLGKMRDVVGGEGRTVLFVSHQMDAVAALCPRAILLDGGRVKADGETGEVLRAYGKLRQEAGAEQAAGVAEYRSHDGAVTLSRVECRVEGDGEDGALGVSFDVEASHAMPVLGVIMEITGPMGERVFHGEPRHTGITLRGVRERRRVELRCEAACRLLSPGTYGVTIRLNTLRSKPILTADDAGEFTVPPRVVYEGLAGFQFRECGPAPMRFEKVEG